MIETITSRQNPRIKTLVSLRDKKGRDKTGSFAVEGLAEIQRALDSYRLLELYYCPSLETGAEQDLRQQLDPGVALVDISPDLMRHSAYRDNPTGLLAVFEAKEHSLGGLNIQSSDGPILILAGLEKPGNIGAIARTAAAAGVPVLGFCNPKTDLYNPNVIRSSRGHWFGLQKAVASPEEWVEWFQAHGITPVQTLVDAGCSYWEFDWQRPVALLLGAEHEGLDPQWEKLAPAAVTIPMDSAVDSLNVSVSTALLLYEIKRQRA